LTLNPPPYYCGFQYQYEPHQTQLQSEVWAALPSHRRLQVEVAFWIHSSTPDEMNPRLTLAPRDANLLELAPEAMFAKFAEMPCVSLAIDAGMI
jgi:hypothetical protein